ncbi:MAG: phosphotransferase, partial [Acidimicrobiales bacterium]
EARYLYDATVDPELAMELLAIVTGGAEAATRVRPVGAEQSNTSLVYDDRIILKVFRRLVAGRNPDVAVTTALHRVGFTHVARPYGVWQRSGYDLGFAQEFLAGGAEGWALALTSLRDFYDSGLEDPEAAGGDFSMEARRLGAVTAQLHLAMADAFGVDRDRLASGRYELLVRSVRERLDRVAAEASLLPERVGAAVGRLAGVARPGPAVRVHGDFHLGQVMRADGGWYVLDFEGEPARPVEERLEPTSPFKDVAGMLRSLDYAARFALQERGVSDVEGLSGAAGAWANHNGEAFLAGYLDEDGVDALLAPEADREAVLAAFELDKALYELDYERAYRPAWEPIPLAALARITDRLAG